MDSQKYFKVYKSSAGSGKTYTLVKEYLCLVLKNPAKFRQVLAITFTNKAANEMKDRIVNQLYQLAFKDLEDNHLAQDLLTTLSFDENRLKDNARKVFQNILHHYSDFAVSTIDSFTHRIVSTFAYDLNLPLRFDVELKSEDLLSTAVGLLVEKVGAEKDLTDILVQFAATNFEEEKNWHVESSLKKISKEIFKEDVSEYLGRLKNISLKDFQEISGQVKKQVLGFEKKVTETAVQAWKTIQDSGLSESDFYQTKSGIGAYFKKLSEGKPDISPNSYVLKAIEEDVWTSSKPSGHVLAAIDGIKDFLRDCFHKIQDGYSLYVSQKQLLENFFSVALLNEMHHIIEQYSGENALLHISEFNKRIAEVVENEPVPFIYERLGEQYKHYLIDEFQDTSVLQWKNLLPLVENNLAQNEFSMVVGDGKQAIYRFRQGEVEQFVDLPKIYKRGNQSFEMEREATLMRNFEEAVLDKNYRSCAEIVNFNNDFFEHIAPLLNEKTKRIYLGKDGVGGLKQIPVRENGYVRIEFVKKEGNKREPYEPDTCQKVFETLQKCLQNGLAYRDIVILARSKKQLKTIAAFLSEQSLDGQPIPLLSAESFSLNNSEFIRFLHSLLKLIHNSRESVAQIEVLSYLQKHKKISLETMEAFFSRSREEKNYSVFDFLNEQGFGLDVNILNSLSMYDLVEELVRVFGSQTEADIYLSAFLNYLATWMDKPQQSLDLLLEDMESQLSDISAKVPSGLNAVELMTIHKSKGLEFPVVIYPFADSSAKNDDNKWVPIEHNELPGIPVSLVKMKSDLGKTHFNEVYEEEQEKNLLDILNVLYVTFTRASEQLYVFTSTSSWKKDALKTYSDFLWKYLSDKGFWKENELVYEFGSSKNTLGSQKEENSHSFTVKEFISTPWMEKVKIETSAKEDKISAKARESVSYGILFHEALSHIFSEDDIRPQIIQMQMQGLIPQEKAEDFIKDITQFVGHPEVAPFFGKELLVKTEAEIVLPTGRILRPDRIIQKPGETLLIDFKTGVHTPQHAKQILTYKKVLEEMNSPSVKAFLLYFSEEKIQVVEAS